MKTVILVFLTGVVLAGPALGQEKLPLGTPVGGPASGVAPAVPSRYDDGGRRDPFVALIAPKKALSSSPPPRPGLGSVSMADVSVKGIVRAGTLLAAILEGPDGKSFVAHAQDKLQDAVVKSIDASGVVFVGQVVDASGAVHTRDVRKALRPQSTVGER